ncbi:hypothetical protein CRV24_002495 [Beauveria bassiana]|nr:hypothetical protein CRV24_002495 [Beauveria bassiana]
MNTPTPVRDGRHDIAPTTPLLSTLKKPASFSNHKADQAGHCSFLDRCVATILDKNYSRAYPLSCESTVLDFRQFPSGADNDPSTNSFLRSQPVGCRRSNLLLVAVGYDV